MTMPKLNLECQDEAALIELAARMAVSAPLPVLIYLRGELGAGKTSFVRAWLQALGVKGRITSPTFTLIEPYQTTQGIYYHFDLYRLKNAQELEMLGFRDYVMAGCFIEWPEKAEAYLPTPDLDITIDFLLPGRRIVITAASARGAAIVEGTHPC